MATCEICHKIIAYGVWIKGRLVCEECVPRARQMRDKTAVDKVDYTNLARLFKGRTDR